MPTTPRVLVGVIVAALALALPAAGAAQQQLASIQGTVTDQTGAILPGVTVTATSVATGVGRSAVTNERGVYRLVSLEPGRYEIVLELEGFGKVVHSDVVLSVGSTLGLNATLEAGGVAERVDVLGFSPDIQTQRADISAVVEESKIRSLPLVARNVMALVALQPGVTGIPGGTGPDIFATEQGLGVTASGTRGSANNAMVDGITISGSPWGGSMLVVPGAESVQEFQVIANNPSAEYGRNSGAAVSVITKGGTNRFSGSVYEFHRNEGLRARGFFETVKPDFSRHDFGGTIGGPIQRDRRFFFFSFDGVRETGGLGQIFTVETEQLVNWVTANRPNSIAAQLLTSFRPPSYPTEGLRDLGSPAPGANVSGPPDGIPDVGTIRHAVPTENRGDQYNVRLDEMVREGNDRIRGTYYLNDIAPSANEIRPGFSRTWDFRNQLFTSGWSRVISNRTLNELSFGFVRQRGRIEDPTPQVPTIGITGISAGFGIAFWQPISFAQNNFEVRNTVTMHRGTHSFRMGGEVRHGRDQSHLTHWFRPNYSFISILDFIDDEPFSETRAVDPATGLATTAPGEYITTEFGFFVQDNWKVRQNLTLTLGLRYDNFGNPSKNGGQFSNIILGSGATRQEQMIDARAATVDRLYDTDWNNFAPRLGLAWDPGGESRMVIRAGAGLSYNRINNTVFTDERLNPPLFGASTASIQNQVPITYSLGPNYPENPALGRGLDPRGGISGARVDLRVVAPDIVTPYYYNWFTGVQRQLPHNFVVDVNYIGTAGRKLITGDGPGGINYNRFAGDLFDGRLDRLNPSFGVIGMSENGISSSYHGLTAQLSRRYSRGFSFQAAYTLGKATDTADNPMEVTRRDLDRGAADFDRRHKLAMNVIWEIPAPTENQFVRHVLGGWQVNTITLVQSGAPFTVVCGLAYPQCDFNADGQTGDRVNRPTFGTSLGSPSQDDWLNGVFRAADFPLPAAGTFGDLERNAYRGPRYSRTDLSLFKNIRPGLGQATVQIRVEAFNVFNTVNLNNPVTAVNNVTFGRVTSAQPGRIIQLGGRVTF